MTLDDVQLDIALEFDNSDTAPSVDSLDYNKRLKLANRFERKWRDTLQTWQILLETTTLSTTAGVAYVSLPSGYTKGRGIVDESGHIELNGSRYKFINFQDKDSYAASDLLCWIIGNDASGYKIYFNPTPDDVYSFDFNYFTKNTATASDGTTQKEVMTTGTDKTKCPKPLYLSYSVLSVLHRTERMDTGMSRDFENMADAVLQEMITENFIGEVNQENKFSEPSYLNGEAPMGGYEHE